MLIKYKWDNNAVYNKTQSCGKKKTFVYTL